MNTLFMMRGLPASGKSTRAKAMIEASDKSIARLNKDLLREMLHFGEYSKENENVVRHSQMVLFRALSFMGDVIIDDTNLRKEDLDKWELVADDLDCKFEMIEMDTDVETCIERDAKREKTVGEKVIRGFHNQFTK